MDKLAIVSNIKTTSVVEVPPMEVTNMPLVGLMGKYFLHKNLKAKVITSVWAGVFTRKVEGTFYLMKYVRAFVHPSFADGNQRVGDVVTVLADIEDVKISFHIFETREECRLALEEQLRRMKEKKS